MFISAATLLVEIINVTSFLEIQENSSQMTVLLRILVNKSTAERQMVHVPSHAERFLPCSHYGM